MKRLRQVSWRRLLRGVFGRVTQKNGLWVQRLAMLRADYNQLKRDADELLRHADKELSELKRTNTGLAREFDDLQVRVWELEQQVDELLLYIAKLVSIDQPTDELPKKTPDLSHVVLGIVGGHAATQREVVNELSTFYGLQRWVVVPPSHEGSFKKSVLKGKLEGCDLIVIITGYMNHSLTHAVHGLKAAGALRGNVVMLNFRGKSGIVREVLRLMDKY